MGDPSAVRFDGGDDPRIDRPILEGIRDRMRTASHFESVAIVTSEGQTRLKTEIDPVVNPPGLERRILDVRWYTNDDFRIHYQDTWTDAPWRQRWNRHPTEHNTRDHIHPPPDATMPGEDRSWPPEYRDMLALALSALAEWNDELWSDSVTEG